MPSDQLPERVQNRDLATMDITDAIEAYTPQFASALPENIPLQRFKRTVLTALNQNPDLIRCNRRSLFLSCVKCAQDGLYPDGREAALVPYEGKVQYLPMVAGIRKRMRNSGEVLSAIAEVVYEKDHFRHIKGEAQLIEHEPPPLDQERGKPVGAYAIIKLTNGETLREVMSLHELERIRAFSKAKDPKAPWQMWTEEMYRKTVLRRCSKGAPTGSEDMSRLLARDDDEPEALLVPPPPPRQEDYEPDPEPEEPTYTVIDCDGEEHGFRSPECAEEALQAVIYEADRRGRDARAAAYENNRALMVELGIAPSSVEPDELKNPLEAAIERHGPPPANTAPFEPVKRATRGRGPAPQPRPHSGVDPRPARTVAFDPDPAKQTPSEATRGKGRFVPAAGSVIADGRFHPDMDDRYILDPDPALAHAAPEAPRELPPGSSPKPASPEGQSFEVAMPLRRGQPDLSTWWSLFRIKARKIETQADFAFLLGDNEASLLAYRNTCSPESKLAAEAEISALRAALPE